MKTAAPTVRYLQESVENALARPGTLAVFGFDAAVSTSDPRYVDIPLAPLRPPAPVEVWRVGHDVVCGSEGGVEFARAGPWLLASLTLDEADHGGLRQTTARGYRKLADFIARQTCPHVLRIWNYLDAINEGQGEDERYKQFCAGRALGMNPEDHGKLPAATAIGHRRGDRRLHLYALASSQPGERVENPRQVSAWRYPPQYGRISPRFARAMRLPDGAVLALSGTAAIVGHQSCHEDDLRAQFEETLANLSVLVGTEGRQLGEPDVLKVYVRLAEDLPVVRDLLSRHLPGVQTLCLGGDICRSELLVEIDGWHYP